jgi:hypothetical protein
MRAAKSGEGGDIPPRLLEMSQRDISGDTLGRSRSGPQLKISTEASQNFAGRRGCLLPCALPML